MNGATFSRLVSLDTWKLPNSISFPEDFHRLRSEMDQLQKELEHQMDRRRALQASRKGSCLPCEIDIYYHLLQHVKLI